MSVACLNNSIYPATISQVGSRRHKFYGGWPHRSVVCIVFTESKVVERSEQPHVASAF